MEQWYTQLIKGNRQLIGDFVLELSSKIDSKGVQFSNGSLPSPNLYR